MPGGAQVGVQDRGMRGDAAILRQVLHAVGDRLLAAVDENVIRIRLEVAIFVVVERCLQVKRLAAARMLEVGLKALRADIGRRST